MGNFACRRHMNVYATVPACFLLLALSACSQQDPAFTESRQNRVVEEADAVGDTPGALDETAMARGEGNTDEAPPVAPQDPQDLGNAAPPVVWVDTNGDGTPDSTVAADDIPEDATTVWVDSNGDGAPDTEMPADEVAAGESSGTETDGSSEGGDGGNGSGTDVASGGGDGGSDDGGGNGDATDTGTGGGSGTEDPPGPGLRVVELDQMSPGKVDILWIVDTSGSMSEEQTYLASNFNALITSLADAGHNFQTAVTTTDVCDSSVPDDLAQRRCPTTYGGSAGTHLRGSFVGEPGRQVLKQSDDDLVAMFDAYTQQGINGSGFEHGLEAAHMAVDKVASGANESLIRPDAFLAVIVVSDEQDDGIGLWEEDAYHHHNFAAEGLTTFKWTEDDMIAYLQGIKGAGQFSISAITGTRNPNGSMCSAPHSQPAEEGTQYIKAAQKTGGIIQSICETNWSNSLGTIGLDLDAQITQVKLPTIPNPSTIEVRVDGETVSTWSYISGNNTVKFDPGHVPPEGAHIKVSYYEP